MHIAHLNSDIRFAPNCKLLGLTLDQCLSWSPHIEQLIKKLNKAYYAIMQLKSALNKKTLLDVYYSLVYSHLSYNVLAWGLSSDLNVVFIKQKQIIRLIFNLGYRDSCQNTFKENSILTLPCILIFKAVVFVKNNFNLFEKLGSNHSYGTRYKNKKLCFLTHNTSFFQSCPYYVCSTLYNNLPKELTDISTMTIFKKRVKSFLCLKGYYTIKEYLSDNFH